MDNDLYGLCDRCGYEFARTGPGAFDIRICALPDDDDQFRALVSRGPLEFRCTRCHKPLRLALPSAYIAEGSSCVHIFVPDKVDVTPAQSAHVLSAFLKRPVQVAFVADAATWRTNLIRAACEPHFQTLNKFMSDRQEVLERCLAQPGYLGKGFQLALYCGLAGYIDMRFAELGSEQAKMLRGGTFLPHEQAGSAGRLDANSVWLDDLRELAALALAFTVMASANHEWTTPFDQVVARPPVLTAPIIGQLGGKIAQQLGQLLVPHDASSAGGLRTIAAFEAMHARQYLGSTVPNPRNTQWAETYVRYQLFLMDADSENAGAEVPVDFARRTLSYREVYAAAMGFPPAALKNPSKIAVYRGALLHAFDPAMTPYVLPDPVESGVRAAIDQSLQVDVDRTALDASTIIRLTRDPEEMVKLAQAAWRELVGAGKQEAALDIVVPITHWLSNTGNNVRSLAFVNEFVETVGTAAISAWSPRVQACLQLEVANCHRAGGDPKGARKAYEEIRQLLGDDLNDPFVRLNMRNLAIALRECGEGLRSIQMLEQLLPTADENERVELESSLLVAYTQWGHRDKALACARRIARCVDPMVWQTLDRRAPGQSASSLLLKYGTPEEHQLAWAILREVYRGADLDGDVIHRGIAAFHLYPSPLRKGFPAGQLERDMDALLAAVTSPGAAKSHVAPQVIEMLMSHPERFPEGRHQARAILQRFVQQWADSASVTVARAWQALLSLGERTRDAQAIFSAVLASLDSMVRLAVTIDPDGDPFHVLHTLWTIPKMAADLVQQSFAVMPPQFAMAASDVGASLVLSARICAKAGMPIRELDDIVQLMTDGHIRRLLPRRAAMVQAVVGDTVNFLITSRTDQGGLVHSLHPSPYSLAEWQALSNKLHYRLNQATPFDTDDPVGRVKEWPGFVRFLEPMLRGLQTDAVLWIAGALSTTPVALAAPPGLRLSFCPSVLAALALTELARKRGIHTGWRPKRAFDTAVWRQAEAAANIDAIHAASASWRRACDGSGLAFSAVSGAKASAAAILQGWADCDVARIACHGRASPDNFASGFLVASENNLPPSAILPRHARGLMPYLLEWNQLAALDSSPAVVISAACDSGQTIHSLANERLGLERAFLMAGTFHYAAPQWPVPMQEVQQMSARLFEQWLAKPGATISGILADLTAAQEANGVPRWIARALTSFGLPNL